jgi:enamine deaminase RidA (YjgF/YER057c/UK114 family)
LQTRQSLTNLGAILAAVGMDLSNATKVNVYLADMNGFIAMNEVCATFFMADFPAPRRNTNRAFAERCACGNRGGCC